MHRHQLQNLRNWLQGTRRKPLVIRGARQVGKSTLVELFCQSAGLELVAVNLERHPDLAGAFAESQPGRNDPAALLNLIGAVADRPLSGGSLLFLDEIQAAPHALASLRYFLEELPERPVIAAGSLMEFALAEHNFPMPVGRVEYLHLGPMTFTEFLKGIGKEGLAKAIETFAWGGDGAPPTLHPLVHGRLLEALRLYRFIGGMPEAVGTYAESGDLRAVSAVQAGIVETYRDDFPKYAARRDLARMLRVFNFAARQVGRKVKYSNVSPDDQSATIRRDIDLLAMAQVVAKVTHSHCSGLPLQAELKEAAFKLIFLDIGLMNALCGLNWQTVRAQTDFELVNAGPAAEQFVGQHLQHLLAERPNRELTYWLREGRSNNAEVDYVAEFSGHILPIEVKAGKAGALKSLHQFVAERRAPLAVRFDANPPALQTVEAEVRRRDSVRRVHYQLLSLPLYLVERLPQIIAGLAPLIRSSPSSSRR